METVEQSLHILQVNTGRLWWSVDRQAKVKAAKWTSVNWRSGEKEIKASLLLAQRSRELGR